MDLRWWVLASLLTGLDDIGIWVSSPFGVNHAFLSPSPIPKRSLGRQLRTASSCAPDPRRGPKPKESHRKNLGTWNSDLLAVAPPCEGESRVTSESSKQRNTHHERMNDQTEEPSVPSRTDGRRREKTLTWTKAISKDYFTPILCYKMP